MTTPTHPPSEDYLHGYEDGRRDRLNEVIAALNEVNFKPATFYDDDPAGPPYNTWSERPGGYLRRRFGR